MTNDLKSWVKFFNSAEKYLLERGWQKFDDGTYILSDKKALSHPYLTAKFGEITVLGCRMWIAVEHQRSLDSKQYSY